MFWGSVGRLASPWAWLGWLGWLGDPKNPKLRGGSGQVKKVTLLLRSFSNSG